jgi:hypothetical protein
MIRLLKQPQALFGLPHPSFQARLNLEEYARQAAAGIHSGSWDQNLIDFLDAFPQVFNYLADDVEVPPEAFPVLSHHPYVVYQMYLKEINPQLELVLQLAPEYCYRLLTRTELPIGQRPYLTASDLMQKILADPNWAMRWCLEKKDKVFYGQLVHYLKQTRRINTASSLAEHRLCVGKLTREQAVLDMRSRLAGWASNDPDPAIWVAENYPELDRKVLYRNCVARKPAYMLYWAQRFPQDAAMVRQEIAAHPAWVADYIRLVKPSDASILWREAVGRCSNPWLAGWMEIYGKTNDLV